MANHFEILCLLARPAAGKSEVIHYLKNLDPVERLQRFHIGEILELDDFPMLWTWFEEDDLLQKMGYPRLHTDNDGYFIAPHPLPPQPVFQRQPDVQLFQPTISGTQG